MTLVQRTWANMITHFREAQEEDLSSLPTAGDIFHQANSMTTMADLVAQRLLEAMPPPPPEPAVPSDTVNTAIITQREISLAAREAALLTQMQEMMTVLRTGTVNNHSQQRRNNRGRGSSGSGRTTTTATSTTTNGGRRTPGPRQYCWSHGACAHNSSECNSPHDGHQSTATFQNMQGGSTNNLQWVPTTSG